MISGMILKVNKPLPQTKFGDKYRDNFDKIFGPKTDKEDEEKEDDNNERTGESDSGV